MGRAEVPVVRNHASRPLRLEDIIRQAGGCLVVDGGLATQLESYGADIKDPLWSAVCLISMTDLIYKVHMDYLRAGAEVIVTASYQATIQGFEAKGMSTEVAESLLRKSVSIACEARDGCWKEFEGIVTDGGGQQRPKRRALVAASIGSYGAYLADGSEYSGDYGSNVTVEDLKDFHRQRLIIIADSGPDLIALETIPSKLEAQALVELLEDEDIKVPAWISFSCKDETRVSSGDSFADCVNLLNRSSKVVAIGINCTQPRYIQDLLLAAQKLTTKPLVVYPNSGETWNSQEKCWVPTIGGCEEDFVPHVLKWRDAGAKLIGGCCRTTPKTVAAIANLLHEDPLYSSLIS